MENSAELLGTRYESGEVIFRQGDVGDAMFIIQSGAVEVSKTHEGREMSVSVLEKGDFFGEMALFQAERRTATIIAIRPTRLLSLTRAALLEKTRRDPGVAFHFLKQLILKIQNRDRQLRQLVSNDDEILSAAMAAPAALPADTVTERLPAPHPAESAAPAVSIHELAEIWGVAQDGQWFEPGQIVFNEGDPGDALYIVLSGAVEISQGIGAEKYVQRRVRAGEIFGDWAIITDAPRFSSAAAIERTQLLPIARTVFLDQMQARPELALYIIQDLCLSLQQISQAIVNPLAATDVVRRSWQPLIKKRDAVRLSIISLSTCAGCSAVLLDDEMLRKLLELADLRYCPMLMDQDRIPEADVALVEGVVRLKEDIAKLEEARCKSRLVVAWGTCAAFGGIPVEANRFELEELLEETYGQTADVFTQYLSGQAGVEQMTYQSREIALLRKAYKIDDFVKADYYVPGCPPPPGQLLQLLGEITGQAFSDAKPVVCGQCSRKPAKVTLTSLEASPVGAAETICFNSLGTPCVGFLIKGGCGAVCPRAGLPCWGCRGPAKVALQKIVEGDSFEEVVIEGLMRRCQLEEEKVTPIIKRMGRSGHALFNFEPSFGNRLSRIR
jgi:F420-non-reducing hydrogenase small subunit